MNVLFIGAAYGVFTYEFISQILNDSKYEITILNMAPKSPRPLFYEEYFISRNIKIVDIEIEKYHMVQLTKNIKKLKKMGKFDVVHIHYVGLEQAILVRMLFKNYSNIIVTFYGSDLFRVNRLTQFFQKRLLGKSNNITVATIDMEKKFYEIFGHREEEKLSVIRMGSSNVDQIIEKADQKEKSDCKRRFFFPVDKYSVFCGYNRYRAHCQLEIIEEIAKLDQNIKNRIHIVCPCGYPQGQEEYLNQIQESINKSGCSGDIITKFILGEELVDLRLSCDIMFNIQKTDALSASMIESFASGAIVIVGKWLKYQLLDELKVFYKTIEDFEDISIKIKEIIDAYGILQEEARGNSEKVKKILSWKYVKEEWLKVIESIR